MAPFWRPDVFPGLLTTACATGRQKSGLHSKHMWSRFDLVPLEHFLAKSTASAIAAAAIVSQRADGGLEQDEENGATNRN